MTSRRQPCSISPARGEVVAAVPSSKGDHAMDKAQAQVVARKWIAAFNDHDLETILSHYTESVELTSLFVTKLLDVPPYEFLLE